MVGTVLRGQVHKVHFDNGDYIYYPPRKSRVLYENNQVYIQENLVEGYDNSEITKYVVYEDVQAGLNRNKIRII